MTDHTTPAGSADELRAVAHTYAATIVSAIEQEYPNHLRHPTNGPDDRPTPREVHPAFYGCLDWHSAVEMHWALVRLLRLVPDAVDEAAVRGVLDAHLTAESMAIEADYFGAHPGWERPYGWGWALMLADELAGWDDPDARRWSANMAPIAGVIADGFVRWLPRMTTPTRDGAHANSAFGCARALPWARRSAGLGSPELLAAIESTARRWFGGDAGYPAAWEPGGADFLSPTLTEIDLMLEVLDHDSFVAWLDRFLPGLAGEPPTNLVTPATVSDPTDGQIAHLHGLNLHRAFGWGRVAGALASDDVRRPVLTAAVERHLAASLPAVSGSDYMVEHWLAAYAVLALTVDEPHPSSASPRRPGTVSADNRNPLRQLPDPGRPERPLSECLAATEPLDDWPRDNAAASDERTTLVAFLDYHRAVLARKAAGLDEAQARLATCPPSDLTMLGLIRHMADVERFWSQRSMLGTTPAPVYYGPSHPDGDDDGDLHPPADATLDEALTSYWREIAVADGIYAAASLDDLERGRGSVLSLRWILVHLVEEYARHCGHADLIRQAIDGATGD